MQSRKPYISDSTGSVIRGCYLGKDAAQLKMDGLLELFGSLCYAINLGNCVFAA
jgi:hypothetical protein